MALTLLRHELMLEYCLEISVVTGRRHLGEDYKDGTQRHDQNVGIHKWSSWEALHNQQQEAELEWEPLQETQEQ